MVPEELRMEMKVVPKFYIFESLWLSIKCKVAQKFLQSRIEWYQKN